MLWLARQIRRREPEPLARDGPPGTASAGPPPLWEGGPAPGGLTDETLARAGCLPPWDPWWSTQSPVARRDERAEAEPEVFPANYDEEEEEGC